MAEKSLDELWEEASRTGEAIPIGRIVVCDVCNDDYTDRPEHGGFIFQSTAYCPRCASEHYATILKFGETHLIQAACPIGQSFADFVRAIRGPDAFIRVTPGKPAPKSC